MLEFSAQKYRDIADEELAQKASSGDKGALSALVARYVFCVRSRASNYLGSGIEVEDLSQEGMIGLIYAARNYNDELGASFQTFAWLCIDRAILSVVRASMQKKKIPKNSLIFMGDEQWSESSAESAENPETKVIGRESAKALMQEITKNLTDFEKQVLSQFLAGLSYKEIAAKLGTTDKSVDNALQRIRRRLK